MPKWSQARYPLKHPRGMRYSVIMIYVVGFWSRHVRAVPTMNNSELGKEGSHHVKPKGGAEGDPL